jgi:hypothetical protein
MPRIVSASVMRSDGRTFEAKLANLTTASLFLITRESLNFRERVSVSMLGVSVEGEVAFAIAEPRLGAVIVFQPTRAVRDVLLRHLDEIEVYAVALGADPSMHKNGTVEESWLESTTAAGGGKRLRTPKPSSELEVTPVDQAPPVAAIAQIPPLGSEGLDLETVDEMPIDPDTLVPHEGAESDDAKKTPPDYTESPTPQNMPVIGAPDLYKRPPLVKGPAKKAKPASSKHTPLPNDAAAAPGNPTVPLSTPPPPPSDKRVGSRAKREDPTIPDLPHDELARIQASIKAEPVRMPLLPSPSASAELPSLEPDACTVLFMTHAHFRAHYETTMMHGGIIVRADPMVVGQQRALVLRIAGLEEQYSLVGRVAFNGKDGSVGFMIESFLHHRPLLEALANRSEAAAR